MKQNWRIAFFTIWGGQAVSILTSAVLQMALIWHLTMLTGSAAVLSVASIAGFLPSALLGGVAGTLVDRWNRKLTMIGADLFIACVSLVLAAYAFFATPPIWLVLVILFVRSIGTAFHTPAISAVTPLLVPESELTRCAGFSESVQVIGYIAGTALAALLYPIWNISGMVALDVLGAVVGTLAVVCVKIPAPPRSEATQNHKPNVFGEMRAGFAALRAHRGLFSIVIIGAVFMVIYSPINALFPLLTMDYFGGTTGHTAATEIAFSVGMLAGGAILGVWGGFRNRAASIVGALVLIGGATGLSGLLPPQGIWGFIVLCVPMGLSAPFYTAPMTALMQERIAPEYLGRAFGLMGSIMSLTMPVGLALSGLFADLVGVHNWFAISGLACVLLAVAALAIPSIRNIEKDPAL